MMFSQERRYQSFRKFKIKGSTAIFEPKSISQIKMAQGGFVRQNTFRGLKQINGKRSKMFIITNPS